MDLIQIRKLMLTAVASDDELVDSFVLKGGNALELIHKIGERASLDLDFSVKEDFEDADAIAERLFRALRDRFDAAGYVLFDEQFGPRPKTSEPGTKWGGYTATFKLLSKEKHFSLQQDLEAMRRYSEVSGPAQQKKFKIEISKFEYCDGKVAAEVDDYTCFVYTPEMIAAEKMRAICQQMPEYELRKNPTPRARDFYDIHSIVVQRDLDVVRDSFRILIRAMFEAKEVPVELLGSIGEYREFHREDWPAVEDTVRGSLEDFDYYYDAVVADAVRLLKALGEVQSPH